MYDPTPWTSLTKEVNKLLATIGGYIGISKKSEAISKLDTYFFRLNEAREALERLKRGLEGTQMAPPPVHDFSPDRLRGLLNGLTGNILALSRRILQDSPSPDLRTNIMIYECDLEGRFGRLFMWLSTDTQSYESLYRPWQWDRQNIEEARVKNDGICVRAFLSGKRILMHDMTGQEQRPGEPIAGMISLPIADHKKCSPGDFGVVNIVSSKSGIIPSSLSADQEERLNQVATICAGVNELRSQIRGLLGDVSTRDNCLKDLPRDSTHFQPASLLALAKAARKFARAPYSKFRVGAALLCQDGTIFSGSNFEVATFDGTNCAERTALFTAFSSGHSRFRAIAVAGPDGIRTMPCGICRQILSEVSPKGELEIVVGREDGSPEVFQLHSLLPHSFTQQDLANAKTTTKNRESQAKK
ncbi:cytidine deaminase [Roseomonas sp. F4]